MKAYILVRVDVKDGEQYKKYLAVTPKLIEKFGGRALARAGRTETLEGPQETRRVVVLEFPSMARAKEFYNSPEYQEARKLREHAAVGELVVVEGVPD